ncbi:hypothetical protein BGZ63DRAFT_397123 [Mariannaea sp. PMI_226]|nr:hypothetical protein BGZ63DRAFT_397123 [Mariannaea sp. PMI_226]
MKMGNSTRPAQNACFRSWFRIPPSLRQHTITACHSSRVDLHEEGCAAAGTVRFHATTPLLTAKEEEKVIGRYGRNGREHDNKNKIK